MNIIHVMPFNDDGIHPVFSGAENHLFTLMQAQQAAGEQVELAVLVIQRGNRLEQRCRALSQAGITVHYVEGSAKPGWLKKAGMIRSLLILLRKRRDWIVHTHLDNGDLIGRLAAWLAGCRNVVTSVHNNEPYYSQTYWKTRLRWLDGLVRHQIAISDAVQAQLVHDMGINGNKVTRIYYGIHDVPNPESRLEARKALGMSEDGFVAGFAGRLTAQKNLEVLIRAAAMLPEVQFVLIGEGDQRGGLEALAQDLALGNITFAGHRENAARLFCALDVFILPSKWEGLGLVLLEAMIQNVPVIGSRAGAIPEILGEGGYGLLFDPSSPEQLASAIRQMRDDPAGTAMRTHAAFQRMQSEFTVDQMVQKIHQIYQQVLQGKS